MRISRKNKLLPACLAGLLLAFSIVDVHAQEPTTSAAQSISSEKRALVRELLDLTSSKKTIDAIFKAQAEQMDKELPEMTWQTVAGMKELKSLTPAQREELRLKVMSGSLSLGRRMYELIQEKIDFSQLIEDVFLPLHDKYFTETELRDLVAFYKSPTGKKVIDVMPELLTTAMKQTVDTMLPKLTPIVAQLQEEEILRIQKEIQATVKTKEKTAKPARRTPQKRARP